MAVHVRPAVVKARGTGSRAGAIRLPACLPGPAQAGTCRIALDPAGAAGPACVEQAV